MSMRDVPSETIDEPGVLFLQLDGVPEPVLRWHVLAGNVPTISRWLRTGTHRMDAWVAALPIDDAGQPGGDPARQQRQHPGVPLVREGAGASSWSPTTHRTPR